MASNLSSKAEFLGRGLGFPPTFDKERQDIVLVEAEIDIQQSLQIILSTLPGERVLAPDFGANLDRLLFEPLDATLVSLMQDIIETALIRHESRIVVNNVLIEEDGSNGGVVLIEVDYISLVLPNEIRRFSDDTGLVRAGNQENDGWRG